MTMHTPAAAIARQLWSRHWRGGAAAIVALLAAAPATVALLPLHYAMLVSFLPLIGVFGFFMNALLFVEDVGSLSSGYPRRMFSLPVPARTLVIWPMLYGSATVALLWVATAWLVYRPWDSRVPVILPALGLAALMAWFQALSWSPLHPSWLRIPAAVILIGVSAGILLGLKTLDVVSPETLAAVLAVVHLVAFPVALAGVASARRGDPWRAWPEGLFSRLRSARSGRRPFRSPFEAQLWYERRCHGLVFPVTVALLSLIFLAVLATEQRRGSWQNVLPRFLLMSLATQAVVASSSGMAVARFAPVWASRRGGPAFEAIVALRPMNSGGLVAAKFGVAAVSVVLTTGVTLVAAAPLILAGGAGETAELWRDLQGRYPGWRAGAVVALGAVCGLALLWRQLTEFVPSVLTGRAWIANIASYAMAAIILVAIVAGIWLPFRPEDREHVLAAFPWLVAIGAIVKVLVTSWAFREAIRRGLIGGRALFGIMALWLAVVASAVGLAALALPAWLAAETRVAAMVGIASFVPLARFALAPLALEWDRHR